MDLQTLAWLGGAVVAALTVFTFIRNIGRDTTKDWDTKYSALFAALSLHEAKTSERFAVLGEGMAGIRVKVDTMWEFILRRAKSELVAGGFGTINSPLRLTEKGKALIPQKLVVELTDLYNKEQPKTDAEFALLIEKNYGDIILNEICIPHGLYMGACLILAMEVVKHLDFKPDENGS